MDKYRLSSDSLNIILQEKQTVKAGKRPTKREVGEVYWDNIAYFSSPGNALKYIVEKEIRESWVMDLKEVIKRIDILEKMIAGIDVQCLLQTPHKDSRGS
jgi:hypothetical protein